MQLKTTGDLRGFLAEVLVGIRDGNIDANQANSISKVAAQINQSLATEVQARMNLKDLGGEAGAMMIAAPEQLPGNSGELPPTEPSKIITRNIPGPAKLEDATANYARNRSDGDKVWCEQCDMRVTVSQAVGCKSPHCKAKDAA